MDKNSIIGYVLIFVIFAGWLVYSSNKTELEQQVQQQEQLRQDSITQAQIIDSLEHVAVQVKSQLSTTQTLSSAEVTVVDSPSITESLPETFYALNSEKMEIQFTSKGGIVNKLVLNEYQRADSSPLVLIEPGSNNFSYTIPLKTGVIETRNLDFTVQSQSQTEIILEHKFAGGGSIEQAYTINDGYVVDYAFRLVELNEKIARKHNSYSLVWDMRLPLQEKTLDNERRVSTVYYKYKSEDGDSEGDVDNLSETSDDDDDLQAGVHWLAFKQQFFMSTLIFPEGLEESGTTISVEKPENVEYVGEMIADLSLPYSFATSDEQKMQWYFGPNHYKTLKSLDMGMESTIQLGHWTFSWVNKVVVIPMFNWLSKYIKSYGLIILLLTLMIKLVLIFPMYKSYLSTAKMKLLKPELEEIKEKANGDMTKVQQEQMKLYKKVGVSPFGGCLPQLVQLPILIALFRFFPSSIELRQKGFLWAKDLSTYDEWLKLGFEIPILHDSHISLFTLLMAASSLLYTIYNQQSQAGMNNQMKYIMYLMPVMLFFWFNSYAAGLSYYYFLANMITFGQNFIFSKFIVDEDKIRSQMEANKKKKVTIKQSRFQKKLAEMAKKKGVDPKRLKR
ncbi:MAG: YidC/Oxa1 family membrane protein insertase [Bacteroidia bacterium]|jgi:YidC/Oxa1 family membrane protein insertase